MRGWFLASTTGHCSDCGSKTRTNDRVFYPPSDDTDTQRLCVECAAIPRDLLELLAMEDAA